MVAAWAKHYKRYSGIEMKTKIKNDSSNYSTRAKIASPGRSVSHSKLLGKIRGPQDGKQMECEEVIDNNWYITRKKIPK